MGKLVGLVMIFPILVAELELGASLLDQGLFLLIERCDRAGSMRTPIIAALVNSNLDPLFPGK